LNPKIKNRFLFKVKFDRTFEFTKDNCRVALMRGKNLFVSLSAVEGQKVLEKQQEKRSQKSPNHSLLKNLK
jgi:hypothetical protein